MSPLTNFSHGITSFGIPLYGNGDQDNSGTTYFVDGNCGSNGNDGKSLAKPFLTLTNALAVSHADIARGSDRWARRNTIWIAGDDFVEDLDLLAQKTDIIGMGSSDNYPMACIRGNHVPITSGSGCRFINIRFRPTASEDLFILSSALVGVEFHKCIFDAHYSAFTAPSAIDATAHQYLKVIGCDFLGAFSANYIDIGAGHVYGMRILKNYMVGSAVNGIMVTGTATTAQGRLGIIADNTIYCPGVTIDDGDDDVFIVTGNNCVSDAATGDTAIKIDQRWAANNWITDATKAGPWPRLDDT